MSTNNFSWKNVLVVVPDFKFDNRCLDEECPHFEEEGEHCEHVDNYYEYDTEGFKEYVEEVQEKLEVLGFESCDRDDYERNYNGNIISELSYIDSHDNIIATIEVVIRNGYYDGMNIDYTLEYFMDTTKTTEQKIKTLCNKVAKVLKASGTELQQLGTMSNGEGVYKLKKINKLMTSNGHKGRNTI